MDSWMAWTIHEREREKKKIKGENWYISSRIALAT